MPPEPPTPTFLLRESTQGYGRESSCSCRWWCCSRDLMSNLCSEQIEGACWYQQRCCEKNTIDLHQCHACRISPCCHVSYNMPWIQQHQHQQQQQQDHHHHSQQHTGVFNLGQNHGHLCGHGSTVATCSFAAPTLFAICLHCSRLIPCASPFPPVNSTNISSRDPLKCGHCLRKFSKLSISHIHEKPVAAASASQLVASTSSQSCPHAPCRSFPAPDFDRFSCGLAAAEEEARHLNNTEHMSMESSIPHEKSSSINAMVHKADEGCDGSKDAKVRSCKLGADGGGDASLDRRRVSDKDASSGYGVGGASCRIRPRLSDFLFTEAKPWYQSISHDQTRLHSPSHYCIPMVVDDDDTAVRPNQRTLQLVPDQWNSFKKEDRGCHDSNVDDGNRGARSDHHHHDHSNSRDFPNWSTVQDWVNSIDIPGFFLEEETMASAPSGHEDNTAASSNPDCKDNERGAQRRSKFQQVHSSDHVQQGGGYADGNDDDPRSVSLFFRRLVSKEYKGDANNSSKRRVIVNGRLLSRTAVKKAEERAGRLRPGCYWYDSRAGFWGVMEGPCLGILPPFIDELSFPMPKHCSNGTTEVYVNGRELHEKDLDVLATRGLPKIPGAMYVLDFDGLLIDETSGKELQKLGKLAPTVEKRGRGFGMFAPSSQLPSKAL